MKSNSLINSSLAALSVANIVFIASAVQAQTPPTPNSFVQCEYGKNGFPVTVAYQIGKEPATLFEWETTEFGPEYTPLTRCLIVSNKLNKVIKENNYNYAGLRLTTGPVNGRVVICVLGYGELECGSGNVLFTLNKDNQRNPGRVIGKLLNIGVYASAGVIREDSGEQVVVDLGEWAKNNFRESSQNSLQQQNPVIEQPKPVQNSGGFR